MASNIRMTVEGNTTTYDKKGIQTGGDKYYKGSDVQIGVSGGYATASCNGDTLGVPRQVLAEELGGIEMGVNGGKVRASFAGGVLAEKTLEELGIGAGIVAVECMSSISVDTSGNGTVTVSGVENGRLYVVDFGSNSQYSATFCVFFVYAGKVVGGRFRMYDGNTLSVSATVDGGAVSFAGSTAVKHDHAAVSAYYYPITIESGASGQAEE